MDYNQVFAVSAAGMSVERTRVDVTAVNLANAHTVADAGGKLFQPMRVVAHSTLPAGLNFSDLIAEGLAGGPQAAIQQLATPPRLVHEPGHPLADAQGFVAYPGVDAATEMVTMMSAMRSYEANVAAMNTSRSMAQKALEIGGGA